MCPGITHLLQFMNREHFSPVCISCSYTHDNSRVNDPAPGGGPQGGWELTLSSQSISPPLSVRQLACLQLGGNVS